MSNEERAHDIAMFRLEKVLNGQVEPLSSTDINQPRIVDEYLLYYKIALQALNEAI